MHTHTQVDAPFQMLNTLNFLVFRVTRGVFFALEAVTAHSPEAKVRQWGGNGAALQGRKGAACLSLAGGRDSAQRGSQGATQG